LIAENIHIKRTYCFAIVFFIFIMSPIISNSLHSASFRDIIVPFILLLFLIVIFKVKLLLRAYHGYALLLWVNAIVSTFINNQSFNRQALTYLFFVLFFILITSISWDTVNLNIVVKSYMIAAILFSITIIGSVIFNTPYSWQRYSLDLIGIHKNPNYVTSFIAIAYCIILYFIIFIKHKSLKNTIVSGLLITIIITSFIFTGTRAGILTISLCTAFQLISLLFSKRRNKSIIILVVIFLLLVLFVINFLPSKNKKRVLNIESYSDPSRTLAWKTVFFEFLQKPIFGLGMGGTYKVLGYSEAIDYLHNILLQLLYDQGLIGFTIFLLLVFSDLAYTKKEDRVLIFSLCIVLFVPIIFQNGLIGVSFWWPVILLKVICNYSRTNFCGILGLFPQNE
jgi:O-antigen ligase